MSDTRELVVSLAEYIAAAGIGTWSPEGMFSPGQTGITTKAMPASPDRVIAISPYSTTNELQGETLQPVQFRCRGSEGKPLDSDDLADSLYQLLHGAQNLNLGPVAVNLAWRQSTASMGQDENRRWETSVNFYLHLSQPTSNTR